jgi:hypothetical protein
MMGETNERHEDRRHEDLGRQARRSGLPFRGDYALGGVLAVALGLAQVKGISTSSDVSARVDQQAKEVTAKVEAQGHELGAKIEAGAAAQAAALSAVQVSLTEIKAQVNAGDKAQDRLSLEIARVAHEVSEHAKALERQAVKSEELERRVTAAEQKGK